MRTCVHMCIYYYMIHFVCIQAAHNWQLTVFPSFAFMSEQLSESRKLGRTKLRVVVLVIDVCVVRLTIQTRAMLRLTRSAYRLRNPNEPTTARANLLDVHLGTANSATTRQRFLPELQRVFQLEIGTQRK